MNLLGMGPLEILVIGIVAMLIMGPDRIGHTFKSISELSKQFKNQSNELNNAITELVKDPIEEAIGNDSEDTKITHPDAEPRPKSNSNSDSNKDSTEDNQ